MDATSWLSPPACAAGVGPANAVGTARGRRGRRDGRSAAVGTGRQVGEGVRRRVGGAAGLAAGPDVHDPGEPFGPSGKDALREAAARADQRDP
ncbi:hypothetical protein KNE206_33260 [Kitasatospora sp. NE20-6]